MKHILSYKKFINLIIASAILFATLGFTSAVSAQSSCGTSYTVQRGDYLTKIAKTCGVSYSDLLKANPGISNPNLTFPGKVLNIPVRIFFAAGAISATLTGTVPANLSQYFILGAAKGQTLNVTATPDDKLQLVIYGVDGSVLRSGMGQGASFTGVLPSTQDYILVLKSGSQSRNFTLKVSIPATPIPVTGSSYTVKRGDTLFAIAWRNQTTVLTLLRLNPQITHANLIYAGQIINLP